MAELFQTSSQNITMHIKNIYDEKELLEIATCKYNLQVRLEGNREVKRRVKFYNSEMIIAIGFRTKSSSGNIFRKWANNTLKEYMIKGFVMDDKRLKDAENFGHDYFDELLLKIVQYVHQRKDLIKRLCRYIQQVSIIIKILMKLSYSSNQYRINCIMQFLERQ